MSTSQPSLPPPLGEGRGEDRRCGYPHRLLHRHQLACLTPAGWAEALAVVPPDIRAPLRAWAARGLPLVVPRQPEALRPGRLALAWTTPLASGRERVLLDVPAAALAFFDEFPRAEQAVPLLPRHARTGARALLRQLRALGCQPRVYGSYGWQVLSGEVYVRPGSDLDLWIAVAHHGQAAEAARALQRAARLPGLRIDGELLFPDGAGVAWREYAAWQDGTARTLLVKRIDGLAVVRSLDLPAWCERAAAWASPGDVGAVAGTEVLQ